MSHVLVEVARNTKTAVAKTLNSIPCTIVQGIFI